MLFLCALWLGQRVEQRRQRGCWDSRVLCENSWKEEEQKEASHERGVGVLGGRRHGDDLSSSCQGGPLGISWSREKTTSAPQCNIVTPDFKESQFSESLQNHFHPQNFQLLRAYGSDSGTEWNRQRIKKKMQRGGEIRRITIG